MIPPLSIETSLVNHSNRVSANGFFDDGSVEDLTNNTVNPFILNVISLLARETDLLLAVNQNAYIISQIAPFFISCLSMQYVPDFLKLPRANQGKPSFCQQLIMNINDGIELVHRELIAFF